MGSILNTRGRGREETVGTGKRKRRSGAEEVLLAVKYTYSKGQRQLRGEKGEGIVSGTV